MKLSEIFTYCNDIILDGAFDDMSKSIDFFNEGQALIASVCPVQAEETLITPASGQLSLPADFESLESVTYDDIPVIINNAPWRGTIKLSTAYDGLPLTVRYYKVPAILLNNDDQVPEIEIRFHRDLATFAAKMYYLKEEETEMQVQFKNEFLQSVKSKIPYTNTVTDYKNF